MIIPLKFGKKCLQNGAFFEEYVCISFYYTKKFMFVMSIKQTDFQTFNPHHKRLQLFHMSSPFAAVLSYLT